LSAHFEAQVHLVGHYLKPPVRSSRRLAGLFEFRDNLLHCEKESEVPMASSIPEKFANLFDKPVFASLATVMPDGSPQVTPVWVDYDGKHVLFNSALGRVKDKNVRRDPRVSLAVQDPENPYRYVEVRGRVVEITQDGADEHINKLSQKYLGKPVYPFRQSAEVRVLYKIKPEHVSSMG
jgi:PPOX class probable F420-dependent enzyme